MIITIIVRISARGSAALVDERNLSFDAGFQASIYLPFSRHNPEATTVTLGCCPPHYQQGIPPSIVSKSELMVAKTY